MNKTIQNQLTAEKHTDRQQAAQNSHVGSGEITGALQGRYAISVEDFCQIFGIGRTHVYEQIASGALVSRRAGRRRLISVDAAMAWWNALPL
jgi:excisionase family DNA binding protein